MEMPRRTTLEGKSYTIDGVDYTIGKEIGKGGKGNVYLVKKNPALVAKIYDFSNFLPQDLKRVQKAVENEITSLKHLEETNHIVNIIASGEIRDEEYHLKILILEHCQDTLEKRRKSLDREIEEGTALQVILELLVGIAEMHQANVVHGDITPENIMFTEDDTLKLIDLESGYSAVAAKKKPEMLAGKSGYLSLCHEHYAHDLFQFAMIVYFIVKGEACFQDIINTYKNEASPLDGVAVQARKIMSDPSRKKEDFKIKEECVIYISWEERMEGIPDYLQGFLYELIEEPEKLPGGEIPPPSKGRPRDSTDLLGRVVKKLKEKGLYYNIEETTKREIETLQEFIKQPPQEQKKKSRKPLPKPQEKPTSQEKPPTRTQSLTLGWKTALFFIITILVLALLLILTFREKISSFTFKQNISKSSVLPTTPSPRQTTFKLVKEEQQECKKKDIGISKDMKLVACGDDGYFVQFKENSRLKQLIEKTIEQDGTQYIVGAQEGKKGATILILAKPHRRRHTKFWYINTTTNYKSKPFLWRKQRLKNQDVLYGIIKNRTLTIVTNKKIVTCTPKRRRWGRCSAKTKQGAKVHIRNSTELWLTTNSKEHKLLPEKSLQKLKIHKIYRYRNKLFVVRRKNKNSYLLNYYKIERE